MIPGGGPMNLFLSNPNQMTVIAIAVPPSTIIALSFGGCTPITIKLDPLRTEMMQAGLNQIPKFQGPKLCQARPCAKKPKPYEMLR